MGRATAAPEARGRAQAPVTATCSMTGTAASAAGLRQRSRPGIAAIRCASCRSKTAPPPIPPRGHGRIHAHGLVASRDGRRHRAFGRPRFRAAAAIAARRCTSRPPDRGGPAADRCGVPLRGGAPDRVQPARPAARQGASATSGSVAAAKAKGRPRGGPSQVRFETRNDWSSPVGTYPGAAPRRRQGWIPPSGSHPARATSPLTRRRDGRPPSGPAPPASR